MISEKERFDAPLQVLVIEDDYLLAEALVDSLTKLGCTVTACASSLEHAMQLAQETTCDLAIVDVDLRGMTAFPVLERLRDRGISFVIASATELEDLPPEFADACVVSKPYDTRELRSAMSVVLAHSPPIQA